MARKQTSADERAEARRIHPQYDRDGEGDSSIVVYHPLKELTPARNLGPDRTTGRISKKPKKFDPSAKPKTRRKEGASFEIPKPGKIVNRPGTRGPVPPPLPIVATRPASNEQEADGSEKMPIIEKEMEL